MDFNCIGLSVTPDLCYRLPAVTKATNVRIVKFLENGSTKVANLELNVKESW